jgi:hypothetical protein
MSENQSPRNEDLDVENVEIEPLSDEALDAVAGGLSLADNSDSCLNCCSCSACSG